MFITKENIDKIIEELELEDFSVYVDMKFFLKDICNPYHISNLKYMDSLDLHKYFIDLHDYMSKYFKRPVHFIYSMFKINVEGIPGYKEVHYSKYFEDDERRELLQPIKKAFATLVNSSNIANEEKFLDSSNNPKDEFGFIKEHHGDRKALVITRDKIFKGYEDMVVVDPYELSSGELKPKPIPEYYKIVLSIIGYKPYSLPGISGIKEKTVAKIIQKILDRGEYIYYNTTSRSQPIFPISYELLYEVSDIKREEYDMILANWKFLN